MGNTQNDDGLDEAPAKLHCNLCGMELPPLEPGEGPACPAGYLCRGCAGIDEEGTSVVVAKAQFALDKPSNLEQVACAAWTAYSKGVGGVAFNGDALPSWSEMVNDPVKAKIVEAWKAAASAAVSTFFIL